MPTWPVSFDLRLDLSDDALLKGIAQAEALNQVIRGIPLPPHVRARLHRLNIMRAVRGTTGIEGSDLTEEEVGSVLAGEPIRKQSARAREVKEVKNAHRVMGFVQSALDRDAAHPVTEGLICELHSLTTEGIDYANNVPGEYRSHPAQAGSYVPPRSNAEVRQLMHEFVAWINDNRSLALPPVVLAVVAHFYLISIHPFGDGNGRTARGLESFLLYRGEVSACGFYSLSNFYYRNRSTYIEMLDFTRFRSGGDLAPFVRFAILGLLDELRAVHSEILEEVTIIAFRDYARETLQEAHKLGTPAGDRMLRFLFSLGPRTVPVKELKEGGHPLSALYKEVSNKTLARDLNYLTSQDLIRQANGGITARLDVMDRFKM